MIGSRNERASVGKEPFDGGLDIPKTPGLMVVETLIWLSRPAAEIVLFMFFMAGRRNWAKESERFTLLATTMYRNLTLVL